MNIQGKEIHHIHFVGIKGIAMAALAVYCKEGGLIVTGSDVTEVFPSDEVLKRKGIIVVPFDIRNITKEIDLVIYTGAHKGCEHPEVKEAARQKIPTLAHGQALGQIMKSHTQISVAGSHGKTTTAGIIASLFSDVSYAIGSGDIRGLGLPGHFSANSPYFVAEADEYVTDPMHDLTPRFLWQEPDILVVTNVDFDHPDVYASLDQVQQAFAQLVTKSKLCILNADDPNAMLLYRFGNSVTYGESEHADFQVKAIEYISGQTKFSLWHKKQKIGDFILHIPGKHNVLNAVAALTAYFHTKDWDVKGAAKRLSFFEGAKRRFERIGERNGALFFDDYAHHPKEIQATLAAARNWYSDHNIIAIFQPHTYSRTKALLHSFGCAFKNADCVITTDIYASARETDTLGITGTTLWEEIKKTHSHAFYATTSKDIRKILGQVLTQNSIVICMGAGDIYTWEKELL